ncbi:MAG: hypothetical protein Q4G39_00380 [Brachymonas sp.]|nr:hypothetical protein [Brachymonas sp.]
MSTTQTPSIQEYLKYAHLQMAAEALFKLQKPETQPGDRAYGTALDAEMLEFGNNRASVFAPSDAAQFAEDWELVEHISNTKTGFNT